MIKSLKLWERVSNALKRSLRNLSPGGALGFSFVLGLYLTDIIPLFTIFLIALLCLAFWAIIRFRQYKLEFFVICLIIFSFIAGIGYRYLQTQMAEKDVENFKEFMQVLGFPNQVRWEGSIDSFIEKYPDKIRFVARVEKILDGNEASKFLEDGIFKPKLYVFVKNPDRRWKYGEKFIAVSSIQESKNFRNPTPPSHQDFQKIKFWKGIYGVSFIDGKEIITLNDEYRSLYVRFLQWIDEQRQAFSDYLDRTISYPESAFLKALTVGYRRFISDEWNEFTSRAGVQHLLAISGLHLASVAVLLFFLVRWGLKNIAPGLFLFIPEPVLSALISLPVVACYAVLAGLAAPTQRSLIAVGFISFGLLLFRKIDFFTIFSLAAMMILITDLSLLYSPSFALSFAAVAGITWVAMVLRPMGENGYLWAGGSEPDQGRLVKLLIGTRRVLFDIFWVSLCVQVVLCPLVIYFFFRFSWAGLIANVALVPYVSLFVVPVGLAVLVGFLVSQVISDIFVGIAKFLIKVMIGLIKFFGNWNELVFWGTPWTSSPVVAKLWIICYWIGLALAVVTLKRRKSPILLTMIILALISASYQGLIAVTERKEGGTLEAIVLDVGDGSSNFIAFPDGKTMIIDGGGIPKSSMDIGSRIIVPAVIALGFRHIDDVVLSHYHYDHAKGLEFLLNSFPVRRFIEPLCPPTHDDEFRLVSFAASRKVFVIPYHNANQINSDFEKVNFQILYPSFDELSSTSLCKNLNRSSTVYKVSYEKTVLVIPSDATLDVLYQIKSDISRKDNEVLLLVAPHHGRCGSFDESLFDEISPDAVIISTKKSKNVPCPAFIQWCKKRNVPCFTTFDSGAIRSISNGKSWAIYGTSEKGTPYLLSVISYRH
ncbi:MAG: ComEC/Rec2 family competence protein [Thermodesulforhabdaceae bacterium]